MTGFKFCGEQPKDDHERDVWLVARRMALLYHYMAEEIIGEAGPEKGTEIVRRAIWKYGVHIGEAIASQVKERGLPLTVDAFRAVPDLPSRFHRTTGVVKQNGRKQKLISLCPLAVTWKELGAEKLGRHYCLVDQAKAHGYNPQLSCAHAQNVLDGDPYCEIVIEPRRGTKESG